MVSVLPSGPSLFGPPNMEFYPPTYHVPRVSSSKNIHLRSTSMPEAVYIQQQQQLAAFKPGRVRHPSGHHQAPVMVSLRRSHTNVADLPRKGFRPRYYEGCELPGLYVARSRSNIAAMGLNPENVYRPSQGLPSKGISRAASFYHHRELNSRSMGFLASANSRSSLALPTSQSCKDLSQPLHVDCSVEYDLGHQPKIPKDSAPLLIIHPAFQNTDSVNVSNTEVQQQTRFHPYSSIPSSPYSEVDHKSKSSSGHGTSLASSSLSSTSSASHKLPTSALPQQPQPKAGPQHHGGGRGYSNKVARHSSFLVTSPPKMVALSRMTPNNKFHLSMPDIAGQEADVQAENQRKFAASAPNRGRSRDLLYNQKAQHVHHQNSKARLNLNAKLEAVRKLSSSSVESSSHCDSGLGTPISLMEASSSTTASQSSSHLSKWRSSMSGLVTGFFCCSTPMPPTPQLQPRRQKPVKQTIINALPPTAVAQQQQYQPQQQQHLHLPPPPPKTHQQHQQPQNVFICAPSWSQQQSSIQAMLQASSRQPPLPRPQVCCRWCQSTNPDGDCRDGFCSSVWNKENLMRPIHI